MNTPSVEIRPGKKLIPDGTKKVVIFDTNAYRDFAPGGPIADSRIKACRLRECERISSVFVLANPTVIWELTAHLADKADPAYNQCLKSLVIIGEHVFNQATGGLNLSPDSESAVCRQLFHCVPTVNEQGVQNLAGFVRHVSNHAPDLSDNRAQENIKHIASQVDAAEKRWVKSMQPVLDRCDPAAAKQFFGDVSEIELRKRMSHFFTTQAFADMWATFTVQMHAAKVGYNFVSENDLKQKVKSALQVFPVPARLLSRLLQKIAMDQKFNLLNPDKKRWNFIWDAQLTHLIGPHHQIGDAPMFFVTADGEVLAAAKEAGCQERVLALPDYLKSVGFN